MADDSTKTPTSKFISVGLSQTPPNKVPDTRHTDQVVHTTLKGLNSYCTWHFVVCIYTNTYIDVYIHTSTLCFSKLTSHKLQTVVNLAL